MHPIWKTSTGKTQKQSILRSSSSTNISPLGTLVLLHLQPSQILGQISKTLIYFPHGKSSEPILSVSMNNSSIVLNATQNAQKARALEKMEPHSNVVIKHRGNYIQHRPYSLILMAKKHTPLLATMIDSIAITLRSYLFGVQMLTASQYCPYTLYKNILPNMHPKKKKNLKASTTCYVELSSLHPLLT